VITVAGSRFSPVDGDSLPNARICGGFDTVRARGGSLQQAHQLIHRQNQQAKHQMAHHLGVALDPDVIAAELVLEPCIHPFRHCALVVAHSFGRIEFDLLATTRVVVNQRDMPQVFTVRPQLGAAIGRVHYVVEAGHPRCRQVRRLF